MIETNKKINLGQLSKELDNAPLNMAEKNGTYFIESCDGSVSLTELENAIDSHIASFEEPSVAEKLASVGLSVEDLKVALGL